MNAEEFVQRLRDAVPTLEQLTSGPDPGTREEAEEFLEEFSFERRTDAIVFDMPQGPLATLLGNYNTSTLRVGAVSFTDPSPGYGGTVVARLELDEVTLNVDDGEVVVREHEAPENILWRCAKDQQHFLEALARVAWVFGQSVVDDALYEDEERRSAYASECATLAGGEAYLSFYQMLTS